MKNKKRIIIVISRMSIGGAQKSLINALSFFDYNRFDVTLYVRENKTELIKDIPETVKIVVNTDTSNYDYSLSGLFFEVMKRFSRLFHLNTALKFFEKCSIDYYVKEKTAYEIKNYKELDKEYDIAISYLQGYTCKFVADNIKAKKYICFYHNSTNATPELHGEYLPKFDNIITVDKKTAEKLEKTYPALKGKVGVIQNIINVDDIKNKSTEYDFLKDSENMLCSCGRLSREKGYDLAIKAAAILKKNGLSFKWYIIGDGPEKEKIENMISEYQLSDYVVLLGEKKNPYPFIASADIFIQPSYEEAHPLSIIEAKILCKPVVSTATVGGKHLVKDGETGVITDISAEGLANGITRLITAPELCEKITENLSKIDYDIEKERYKKNWEFLIGGVNL